MRHLTAHTDDLRAMESSDARRLLDKPRQIQAELPQTRLVIGAVHAATVSPQTATHAGTCEPVAVFAGVPGVPEVTASDRSRD